MNSQIFENARRYAENRLERELSPKLLYHGIGHTRAEVVPAATTFADGEGVQGESLYMLLTAAWFHDVGFIHQSVNHESISAQIAREILPSFGYTEDQVETVGRAILSTALPQSPTNLLEQILADADLDMLGRANFMQRNQDLRQELAFFGTDYTDMEWYSVQLRFLEEHKYFTASARALRDIQKTTNINELRKKLKLLTEDK